MKGMFLFVILSLGFNTFGMERVVYFNTIHKDNPKITAKVSEGMMLFDSSSLQKVNELVIPSEEEDGFEVSLNQNCQRGIVSVYDINASEQILLKFSLEKISRYSPATIKLLEVATNTKAILYRPSMGGGDRFVLLISNRESDFSMKKIQESLPFGKIQFYIPICEI